MVSSIPHLDAMTHDQLERWIAGASPRQLYQAIETGQAWLNTFTPETEDDETLTGAVRDRLDMLERAYQLTPGLGMEPPQYDLQEVGDV